MYDLILRDGAMEKHFLKSDLNVHEEFIMCLTCHKSSEHFLIFISNCIDTEEKLKEYCNVESNGQMVLSSFIQFMSSVNTLKRDGECFGRESEKFESTVKDFMGIQEFNIKVEDIETKVERYNCERYQKDCSYSQRPNIKSAVKYKEVSELKEYECKICLYQSNCEDRRQSHILTHKCNPKVAKCRRGVYQIKPKDVFKRHTPIHKNPSKEQMVTNKSSKTTYSCKICTFETTYKTTIKEHMETHTSTSKKTMHKCNMCMFQSGYKRNLKRHMLTHKSASEVRTYKCNMCEFQTKHNGGLKRHMLIHKNTSELTIYKCNMCLFQSTYKRSLQRHMFTHKKTSETVILKCEVCPFQTKYPQSLERHTQKHNRPPEVKTYKCALCAYKFKLKGCLKAHMLTHMKNCEGTMFKCEICEYQTKHQGNVLTHMLTHKSVSSEVMMFKCDICAFQTKYKADLQSHILTHKSISEVPIYKCYMCMFESKHKRSLRRHVLIHKTRGG